MKPKHNCIFLLFLKASYIHKVSKNCWKEIKRKTHNDHSQVAHLKIWWWWGGRTGADAAGALLVTGSRVWRQNAPLDLRSSGPAPVPAFHPAPQEAPGQLPRPRPGELSRLGLEGGLSGSWSCRELASQREPP